jgi:hypothetical protein
MMGSPVRVRASASREMLRSADQRAEERGSESNEAEQKAAEIIAAAEDAVA